MSMLDVSLPGLSPGELNKIDMKKMRAAIFAGNMASVKNQIRDAKNAVKKEMKMFNQQRENKVDSQLEKVRKNYVIIQLFYSTIH